MIVLVSILAWEGLESEVERWTDVYLDVRYLSSLLRFGLQEPIVDALLSACAQRHLILTALGRRIQIDTVAVTVTALSSGASEWLRQLLSVIRTHVTFIMVL